MIRDKDGACHPWHLMQMQHIPRWKSSKVLSVPVHVYCKQTSVIATVHPCHKRELSVRTCCGRMQGSSQLQRAAQGQSCRILPLHGSLPPDQQVCPASRVRAAMVVPCVHDLSQSMLHGKYFSCASRQAPLCNQSSSEQNGYQSDLKTGAVCRPRCLTGSSQGSARLWWQPMSRRPLSRLMMWSA